MGWFAWLSGRSRKADPRLLEWRATWARAVAAVDPLAARTLAAELDATGLPDQEIEIEREMLDALDELLRLRREVDRSGLPVVTTGHRVIGADTCHFTAAVSMPDDEAQPAGRLLLTSARAVFAGGARTRTVPWHGVGSVVQPDRDIVLVRTDRASLYRFRCNTYADAICGALIARELVAQSRAGRAADSPAARRPTHVEGNRELS